MINGEALLPGCPGIEKPQNRTKRRLMIPAFRNDQHIMDSTQPLRELFARFAITHSPTTLPSVTLSKPRLLKHLAIGEKHISMS